MNYLIRPYKESDLNMISEWWISHGETPPIAEAMTNDDTFIFELNNIPAMAVSIYLTQNTQISLLEGYVKNPGMKKVLTREHSEIFLNYVLSFAKDKGYKRVVLVCPTEKLKKIYESFGMRPIAHNITSFDKEL